MTYAEKIDALSALQPGHTLLRLLASAQSRVNELILDRELKKARSAGPPVANEQEEEEPGDNPVLNGLHVEKSRLYGERAKLSNTFHDCRCDADRRRVSEKIQIVQARIEAIRRDIRTYKAEGRLPEQAEEFPVPEDAFRLLGLRDSLRAAISRKKREVGAAGEDAERLARSTHKLNHLQKHLSIVQATIENRNIQPGRLSEG